MTFFTDLPITRVGLLLLALVAGCARAGGEASAVPAPATPADGHAATPGAPAVPVAGENPQQSLSIILRTSDAAAELPPALLDRLGAACDARLAPVRPMSGGAHVLTLVALRGDGRAALDCIARQPGIDYAEPDARARPATGGAR